MHLLEVLLLAKGSQYVSSLGRYLMAREPPWEQNELPWEYCVETNRGGEAETKPNFIGGRE